MGEGPDDGRRGGVRLSRLGRLLWAAQLAWDLLQKGGLPILLRFKFDDGHWDRSLFHVAIGDMITLRDTTGPRFQVFIGFEGYETEPGGQEWLVP